MKYALRITEAQHAALRSHLFPGDDNEAVALLLCGRRTGAVRHVLTVKKIVAIPHAECDRRPDSVTWPTDYVDPLLGEAYGRGYAIVKVHCHGIDYRRFSKTDDRSDKALFSAVTSLLNDDLPHASLIMLPDGELFGRMLGENGAVVASLASVMVVGDDIRIWSDQRSSLPAFLYATPRHLAVAQPRSSARCQLLSWDVPGQAVLSWNNWRASVSVVSFSSIQMWWKRRTLTEF